MNLILLNDKDFISEKRVILKGKTITHIKKVLKSGVGDSIKVGRVNSLMGVGKIVKIEEEFIELDIDLTSPPPKPLDVTLIMAMVRPKSLKKALHIAIAMGIKDIYIIKTWRVEKSFWSSPVLDNLDKIVIEALEQAKDTTIPNIHIRKRFKPFVEDELPTIIDGKEAIIAHPISSLSIKDINVRNKTVLAIGPEGGFIDYEVEKLNELGFKSFHLGERILRVEFAIPVILGRFL